MGVPMLLGLCFITFEGERSEYRLQPAWLGSPTLPAEAGTLNAVIR